MPAFAQDAPADDAGETASQSEIIVTGTRGQARTVISSPTPIDVIGGEELEKLGGGMQLRDALTQLAPSFPSTTVGRSTIARQSVGSEKSVSVRVLLGIHRNLQ